MAFIEPSGQVFPFPLTARVRFEGKDEVAALHRDIFAVLEDLNTTEPLSLGDTRSFSFEQGQIVELTIFGRPLPGLAALFAALPPRVSARRRGRVTGALVAVLTRPLAFVLGTADRLAPRVL